MWILLIYVTASIAMLFVEVTGARAGQHTRTAAPPDDFWTTEGCMTAGKTVQERRAWNRCSENCCGGDMLQSYGNSELA